MDAYNGSQQFTGNNQGMWNWNTPSSTPRMHMNNNRGAGCQARQFSYPPPGDFGMFQTAMPSWNNHEWGTPQPTNFSQNQYQFRPQNNKRHSWNNHPQRMNGGRFRKNNHPRKNFHPRNDFQNSLTTSSQPTTAKAFYCDACDRGYDDESKFKEHVKEHQKCSYEGCSYVAAPKLVQIHIKLQHRTGLAKKIWMLESKEDIQKWILERKKHFPTKENIQKKKEEQEARIARGEIIETAYFGKMKKGKKHHQNVSDGQSEGPKKRNRNRRMNERRKRKQQKNRNDEISQNSPQKKSKVLDSEIMPRTCVKDDETEPVDPLSLLVNSCTDSDIENEELGVCSSKTVEETTQSLQLSGALGMISSAYDADCTSEDENKDNNNIISPQKNHKEPCEHLQKAESPKLHYTNSKPAEHLKDESHQSEHSSSCCPSVMPTATREKKKQNRVDIWKRDDLFCVAKKGRQSTLLKKLLAEDIRHERNLILQCVHYIVKKNFLNTSQTKSIQTDAASNKTKNDILT